MSAPIRLLALFLLLTGVPLVALAWLGWRVLQQDRLLEVQRLRERLDNGASLIAGELHRDLRAWDALLTAAGSAVALPPRAVFLLIDPQGVIRDQGVRLPYYPQLRSAR